MRILIVDDERPTRSELCHLINSAMPEIELDEADSGASALEKAGEAEYDAFFVDIHLGDITGMALAATLKKLQPEAAIVFATAYDEYAVRAFDLEATDYIMKPFDPRRVEAALHKVCAGQHSFATVPAAGPPAAARDKLCISTCDKKAVFLDVADLLFIEADNRTCTLHTQTASYATLQALGYFEKRLAQSGFFRIHKSYLINLQLVEELAPWFNGSFCVRLRGWKDLLPVGRKQARYLRENFE